MFHSLFFSSDDTIDLLSYIEHGIIVFRFSGNVFISFFLLLKILQTFSGNSVVPVFFPDTIVMTLFSLWKNVSMVSGEIRRVPW